MGGSERPAPDIDVELPTGVPDLTPDVAATLLRILLAAAPTIPAQARAGAHVDSPGAGGDSVPEWAPLPRNRESR